MALLPSASTVDFNEKPPLPPRVDPGAFIADALTKAGILDADSAHAYGSLFGRYMRQQRRAHLDWCVAGICSPHCETSPAGA
jgi:hypothetical protein